MISQEKALERFVEILKQCGGISQHAASFHQDPHANFKAEDPKVLRKDKNAQPEVDAAQRVDLLASNLSDIDFEAMHEGGAGGLVLGFPKYHLVDIFSDIWYEVEKLANYDKTSKTATLAKSIESPLELNSCLHLLRALNLFEGIGDTAVSVNGMFYQGGADFGLPVRGGLSKLRGMKNEAGTTNEELMSKGVPSLRASIQEQALKYIAQNPEVLKIEGDHQIGQLSQVASVQQATFEEAANLLESTRASLAELNAQIESARQDGEVELKPLQEQLSQQLAAVTALQAKSSEARIPKLQNTAEEAVARINILPKEIVDAIIPNTLTESSAELAQLQQQIQQAQSEAADISEQRILNNYNEVIAMVQDIKGAVNQHDQQAHDEDFVELDSQALEQAIAELSENARLLDKSKPKHANFIEGAEQVIQILREQRADYENAISALQQNQAPDLDSILANIPDANGHLAQLITDYNAPIELPKVAVQAKQVVAEVVEQPKQAAPEIAAQSMQAAPVEAAKPKKPGVFAKLGERVKQVREDSKKAKAAEAKKAVEAKQAEALQKALQPEQESKPKSLAQRVKDSTPKAKKAQADNAKAVEAAQQRKQDSQAENVREIVGVLQDQQQQVNEQIVAADAKITAINASEQRCDEAQQLLQNILPMFAELNTYKNSSGDLVGRLQQLNTNVQNILNDYDTPGLRFLEFLSGLLAESWKPIRVQRIRQLREFSNILNNHQSNLDAVMEKGADIDSVEPEVASVVATYESDTVSSPTEDGTLSSSYDVAYSADEAELAEQSDSVALQQPGFAVDFVDQTAESSQVEQVEKVEPSQQVAKSSASNAELTEIGLNLQRDVSKLQEAMELIGSYRGGLFGKSLPMGERVSQLLPQPEAKQNAEVAPATVSPAA